MADITNITIGTTNYTIKDEGAIRATEKGANSGVATLGADGKVPANQLPSYVDDVIEGFKYLGKFYEDSTHTKEIPGEGGKIYVDLFTEKTYRYSGSAFVEISSGSLVTVTREFEDGTKIMSITIDGYTWDIFIPTPETPSTSRNQVKMVGCGANPPSFIKELNSGVSDLKDLTSGDIIVVKFASTNTASASVANPIKFKWTLTGVDYEYPVTDAYGRTVYSDDPNTYGKSAEAIIYLFDDNKFKRIGKSWDNNTDTVTKIGTSIGNGVTGEVIFTGDGSAQVTQNNKTITIFSEDTHGELEGTYDSSTKTLTLSIS